MARSRDRRGSAGAREQPVLNRYTETDILVAVKIQNGIITTTITT